MLVLFAIICILNHVAIVNSELSASCSPLSKFWKMKDTLYSRAPVNCLLTGEVVGLLHYSRLSILILFVFLDEHNDKTYLYFIHPDDSNYHHPSCNQSCIVTDGTFYDLTSSFSCDFSEGFVQTLVVADSDYPSITFEVPL